MKERRKKRILKKVNSHRSRFSRRNKRNLKRSKVKY